MLNVLILLGHGVGYLGSHKPAAVRAGCGAGRPRTQPPSTGPSPAIAHEHPAASPGRQRAPSLQAGSGSGLVHLTPRAAADMRCAGFGSEGASVSRLRHGEPPQAARVTVPPLSQRHRRPLSRPLRQPPCRPVETLEAQALTGPGAEAGGSLQVLPPPPRPPPPPTNLRTRCPGTEKSGGDSAA